MQNEHIKSEVDKYYRPFDRQKTFIVVLLLLLPKVFLVTRLILQHRTYPIYPFDCLMLARLSSFCSAFIRFLFTTCFRLDYIAFSHHLAFSPILVAFSLHSSQVKQFGVFCCHISKLFCVSNLSSL